MRYLNIILLVLILCGCKKQKSEPGSQVEIYLLSSFQSFPNKCRVNPVTAVLHSNPLVLNNDIVEYSYRNYAFRLSDVAIGKIKTLSGRTPFALAVDKKVIYYGFFMPMYMSSTCLESITMDVGLNGNNTLSMQLGYPGTLSTLVDDQRNSPLLLSTLEKQGKLR